MSRRLGLTSTLSAFMLAILTACGGGGSDAPPASTPPPVPATTAVGVTDGNLNGSGATITAAGGSISTGDNKITLAVPAGALAADTQIQIFRITNTAHGGIGGGFRLEPDGQTFSQPVTLTFTYTDDDLAGSDPEILGTAFQTATGYWQWMGTPVIDTNAKTISITTTHFTDFSMVKGYQLQPGTKSLRVNTSQAMKVVFCYVPSVAEDDLQPLGYACNNIDAQSDLVPSALISEWSVNGTTGGNSTNGTVTGNGPDATYRTPATKPTPNTVAVSAKIDLGGRGKRLVVSNITITDQAQYTGTVNFTTTVTAAGVNTTGGVANVTWTLTEDLPDVKTYTASGTISGNLIPLLDGYTCAPVPVTSTIDSSNRLLVYTSSNTIFSNTHAFTLTASDINDILTTTCTNNSNNNTITSPPFPKLLYVFVGGNCLPSTTPQPVAFTDETHLSGNYNCPGVINFSGTNANWNFTQ